MIGLMEKEYWLLMEVVDCLLFDLSVGDLLEMKKCEVVFVMRFVKEKMMQEAFVVVGMCIGRTGVAFVVVVEECWGSFVELHFLLFEALLFEMMRSVS